MNFIKLIDAPDEHIWSGTVFRFPAKYPFETQVDFMLYEGTNSESGFSLLCTTGGKAGSKEGWLPKATLAPGKVRAISRDWLIKNWQKWVYRETPVSEVMVTAHYPEGVGDE